MIVGYDYDKWEMDPAVEAFETLAGSTWALGGPLSSTTSYIRSTNADESSPGKSTSRNKSTVTARLSGPTIGDRVACRSSDVTASAAEENDDERTAVHCPLDDRTRVYGKRTAPAIAATVHQRLRGDRGSIDQSTSPADPRDSVPQGRSITTPSARTIGRSPVQRGVRPGRWVKHSNE